MAKLVSRLPQLATEFATPRLRTFWRYAKVELKPPTPGEFPEVAKRAGDLVASASSGKWTKLTVKVSVFFSLNKRSRCSS